MNSLLDIAALEEAIRHLPPGEGVVYHRGLLTSDRQARFGSTRERRYAEAVDRLASVIMAEASRRALILYQRRLGEGSFDYPLPPAEETACARRLTLSDAR